MSPDAAVPAVLGRARDLVSPALRRALDLLVPEIRPLVQYHHGFVDAAGHPTGDDGGKGFRPALAVLSAEAAGADSSVGVTGAVAVELVHNFSLIHDDVIDEDDERRHRPTVWAVFGVGPAVIAGDALLALAQQVVLEPGLIGGGSSAGANSARAARVVADATAAMIAGQALDMAFESEPEVGFARCLEMEAGKTGALLGCAASIGALLAGADDDVVNGLRIFGVELGLAFQAVDDLLGIWGDPHTTGKPTYSDLRRKKKSLPVAAALEAPSPAARELAELLAAPEIAEEDLSRAAQLVEECGGRASASEQAKLRLESALRCLDALGSLDQAARAELVELAEFVVERQF